MDYRCITDTSSVQYEMQYRCSLGDTVNFKLKNTVAGSNDIKLTTYAVYDDMSAGLTLNKRSFKVTLVDACLLYTSRCV